MSRLIDADKIKYHEHTECMGHGDFETVRTVTDKEIAEIPTVDAVPVTRCKACANFRQNAHGVCWCDEYGGAITPNDYCSRAVSDKQPRASIPWEAD